MEVRCDVKMASSLEGMCSRDLVAVSALALCGVCCLISTKVEVRLEGSAFAGTIVTSNALGLMKSYPVASRRYAVNVCNGKKSNENNQLCW